MRRLTDTAPGWVSLYSGIEFKERGRSREAGLDCWGMVRLLYAEQFGILLDDRFASVSLANISDVGPLVEEEVSKSGLWTPVDGPSKVGDVCLFRIRGVPSHVGVAVSKTEFVHSLRGSLSVVERFDCPVWNPRLVGWYRFSGPVVVRARPSIFDQNFRRIEIPQGVTVEEIVRLSGFDPGRPEVRAYLGDAEVPASLWKSTRPLAGRVVSVALVPQGGGGGKDGLRVAATIAVIVGAVFAGPAVATAIGFTATGSAAAIATATIGLGGSLAVNALVAPPSPSLSTAGAESSSSISPSIVGGRNEIRKFGPVPAVLGTYRFSPPYGARPYTEVVGSDQYLRCMFIVGYGTTAIEDLRIGETPIDEFEGVEYEIRTGRPGEEAISLYPGVVLEESLSVELNAVDGWTSRTTEVDADEISVDVTLPQGLAVINDDGSRGPAAVSVEVEYAVAGSGVWVSINAGSPSDARSLDYLFRTPEVRLWKRDKASGGFERRIYWSANGVFPDGLPPELEGPPLKCSWEASGWIYIPFDGEYQFAIDSSSASDLTINGATVATFYGEHPPAGTPDFLTHQTPALALRKGFNEFRFRVETRNSATLAAALGWKRPGDSGFSVVPLDAIAYRPENNRRGYNYRIFDTAGYGSAFNVSDSRVDQIRRSLSWAVPQGQYDVRLRRVTPDTDSDRILDTVLWTAIRTIRHEDPVRIENLARVALRIKATDQLNGIIDDFNVVATSIVPDYDAASDSWIERATSNPASLYRYVLQHPGNKRRLTDGRLDLETFESWHAFNESKGFTFNAVLDFSGTVYARLQQVAAAGRGSFGMRDGLFSVVIDRPRTTPVQHFTPRNSRGFRGRRAFPTVPHALRVAFMNAAKGYQQDERVVYDDGYDEDNATEFEVLELFGCTDADLAWKHGRYFLAVGQLRPEVFELTVGVENLVCQRGDLVLVTHDVPLLGIGYGRISQVVTTGAGLCSGVIVDAPIEMEAGRLVSIRCRRSDGVSVYRNLVPMDGEQTTLTFDSPIPPEEPHPQPGNIFGYGDRGTESREMVVRSIVHGRDLSATLTLVDAAPGVHVADEGEIPDFDSGINDPPEYDNGPYSPIIDSIRSDDFVMVRDEAGNLRPRIVVFLRRPSASNRPAPAFVQARIREDGDEAISWRYLPNTPVDSFSVSFDGVETGRTYDLAVRYISLDGRRSGWTSATHTVIGHTLPPPDVDSFDVFRLADGTRRYVWELGDVPPDVVGVRLRYLPIDITDTNTQDWEDLLDLTSGVLEGSSPTDLNIPPTGSYRFGIKMVDASGLESRNAVFVDRTLGPPPQEGVALSEDARVLVWPGTRTNAHVNVDGTLVATSQTTWATIPATWAAWGRWNSVPWPLIEYEHPTIDAETIFDFEPDAVVEALGNQPVEVLFDYSVDNVTWQGYQNLDLFESRTVRARYVKYKVSVGNATNYPIPTLVRFTMLLRALTVTEVLDNIDVSALGSGMRIGPGWFFAPISQGLFSVVRSVSVTFNGSGAGRSWELIAKNVSPGPEIKIYNDLDIAEDAVVDVTVRGFGVTQ